MKKKKKGLLLVGLCGCLLVLGGVYMGLQELNNEQENVESVDTSEDSEIIVLWNEEKTQKISIFTKEREKISFKKNEKWEIEGYKNFPLVQEEITGIFEDLDGISAERKIEEVEDLSEYGLDDPVNVISIETEDGEKKSLAIGLRNETIGCTYVYLDDKTDVVYTVSSNLENIFQYDLYDFAESEVYPSFYSDNVKSVEVIKEENSFEVLRAYMTTTGWQVNDEVYGTKLADDEQGGNLASMVSVLSYANYYEYDCKDFATYGLDKPQMQLRVKYTETVEVVEESEESEDEKEEESEAESEDEVKTEILNRELLLSVGDFDEDGYYYVRLNDSCEVHGIAETHIEKLLGESAVDYWALNMSEIALDDLDYLEVQYAGETYVLSRNTSDNTSDDSSDDSKNTSDVLEKDDDSENNAENEAETEAIITYLLDDREVDEELFRDFYNHALGVECQERKTELEITEEAELKLTFYGVYGKVVNVSYVPWDGSFYAAINNETDFGLVNKMTIKNLIELFETLIESE